MSSIKIYIKILLQRVGKGIFGGFSKYQVYSVIDLEWTLLFINISIFLSHQVYKDKINMFRNHFFLLKYILFMLSKYAINKILIKETLFIHRCVAWWNTKVIFALTSCLMYIFDPFIRF